MEKVFEEMKKLIESKSNEELQEIFAKYDIPENKVGITMEEFFQVNSFYENPKLPTDYFYKDLKEYFHNTPDEQIEKDWNEPIDLDNVSYSDYRKIIHQKILK